jgi:Spy/CpxP family protein refolding chaperone
MSAKRIVVVTVASLLVAGGSIAGPGRDNSEGRRGRECDGEHGGKGCREQMERMHHRHGPKGGGIDRLINNPEVREQLGITGEQLEQLKEAREKIADQRDDLVARMKETREKQMKLMQADKLDKEAIMKAVNESGKIRTKLDKLRVKGLFLVQDILTDEQLGEIKERMQKHMRERRGNKKNKRPQGKRNKDRGPREPI